MDSRKQIEELAAQWIARRDSETWTDADQLALAQWLNASTSHVVTFLRLEAAWQQANRLKALGAGFAHGIVPTAAAWRASPYFNKSNALAMDSLPETPSVGRPRRILPWAIAATVVLAVSVFALNYGFFVRSGYSTPVGGLSAVPLSDGSRVTLNTNSEIRVAVTSTERRIELEQGEAFFEVAKDAVRPFIVGAGDKRIVAVGTKFSVRRDANDVSVVVTEGQVRVEQGAKGRDTPATRLVAGNVAHARATGVIVQERSVPEVEEILSWRSGYVIFHETALADAVAEFNRYNTRKIVIEDPTIAGVRIAGNFRATNVEAFLRLLEGGLPIRTERRGDRIVLTAY